MRPIRILKNQSGQLSADFLFAIVVSFGLFQLFFSLTFTFSVIEVTQYIAFSTARAHAAGHASKDLQRDAAEQKYKQLLANPAFAPLFQNGWFEIPKALEGLRQGGSDTFVELSGGTDQQFQKAFTGVSIPFESKMLELTIPFISKGSEEGGFKTNVNAVLIRETSQEECQAFWKARAAALSRQPTGKAGYSSSAYTPMEDNGC